MFARGISILIGSNVDAGNIPSPRPHDAYADRCAQAALRAMQAENETMPLSERTAKPDAYARLQQKRREHLEAIAEVLRKHDIVVLSDEIYAELTYNGRHISIAEIDGMKERTVIVNGFSKSFAMTGWRLGFLCGPAAAMRQMLKIHQYALMCAPTTAQYAAIEALDNCEENIAQMRDEYNLRRRFIVDAFNLLGLQTFEP